MLFCIDIGNTNIVLGVTDQEQILHHWRIRTEKETTVDELAILIGTFFQWKDIKISGYPGYDYLVCGTPAAQYRGRVFTPLL